MFNKYTGFEAETPSFYEPSGEKDGGRSPPFEEIHKFQKANEQPKGLLNGLFSGNKSRSLLDPDTLLLILMVFFLVYDKDGEKDGKTDTGDILLIAGLLLLLGL